MNFSPPSDFGQANGQGPRNLYPVIPLFIHLPRQFPQSGTLNYMRISALPSTPRRNFNTILCLGERAVCGRCNNTAAATANVCASAPTARWGGMKNSLLLGKLNITTHRCQKLFKCKVFITKPNLFLSHFMNNIN